MIRYVAAIHNDPEATSPLDWEAFGKFQRNWTTVFDGDRVRVWATGESRAFTARNYPTAGRAVCVIGCAFDDAGNSDSSKSVYKSWGAFIAVTIEANERIVRVYREPTGRIECWRVSIAGFEILFSHLEDVLPLVGRLLTINWDYLAFHLTNRWLHNEQTGYREILELLPGDEITYEYDKAAVARKWHPASFIAEPHCAIENARSAMRGAAERVVGSWASLYRSILIDLSGGLDSAIVLGLLRRHARHSDVIGVNYVIKHAEGDEREYANEAAQLHGISVMERDPAEGLDEPPPAFALRLLRPAIRTLPLGYDFVATSIQQRLKREAFFTGTGGDHVFYDHLNSAASVDHYRERGFRGLVGQMHLLAQLSRSTIWSGMEALYADIRTRDSDAMQALMRKCAIYFRTNPFLSSDAATAIDLNRFMHPVVLEVAQSATPSRLIQIVNIIELQKHYWRYGRADESDEVHPLFSQPMLETSLRTPCNWFCTNGIQRGLARAAFSDLLPPSILTRRFKSSNNSHWLAAIARELPQFRSLLLDGALAKNGMLARTDLAATTSAAGLLQSTNFSEYLNTVSVSQWVEQAQAVE